MYGLSAYLKMVKGKIVPIKTFSAILNGRAGISPEMALRHPFQGGTFTFF